MHIKNGQTDTDIYRNDKNKLKVCQKESNHNIENSSVSVCLAQFFFHLFIHLCRLVWYILFPKYKLWLIHKNFSTSSDEKCFNHLVLPKNSFIELIQSYGFRSFSFSFGISYKIKYIRTVCEREREKPIFQTKITTI